jgi:23S rRNA pseudouridine2605 synthase
MENLRLNVYLARCGLGSRRSVEQLILDGKIRVNGTVANHPGKPISLGRDSIEIEGRKVVPHESQYIVLHKPQGYACTKSDPHASKTIYDLLPDELNHLNYAGRLDTDSEGMVLLSNDGDWIHQITHPRFEVIKTYHIQVNGHPAPQDLDRARQGIRSEGELLKPKSIRPLPAHKAPSHEPGTTWLEICLNEGKKREIRRIFKHINYKLRRLIRISTGDFSLTQLSPGGWRELTPPERTKASRSSKPRPTNQTVV